MIRFFVTFLGLLALLFGLELTPPAQHALVVPWTDALARIAASAVTWFDPGVSASGNVLRAADGSFAVSIEAGCNGVEATLVLLAAMLAFPAPWTRKLGGIAIGTLAVQGLNVVRVISLFYLGQWSHAAFEWAHLYVWQALIMLDVLVVWLLWVRSLPRDATDPPLPPGAAAQSA
jgi:exosortase H (IPTLxxWG-CTERM-specific)